MFKLSRMEISGFKSFGDRTEVQFPEGITAVVGPNGCGKSNIGDALNWVLGEQSPKMLRGRAMTDVIFNGTRTRKPIGMAEVSLHFSGAEGLPHADNGAVVITRRLFRSGDSDYRINGARARLKDIQELLRAGHIGSKSYATIEQGKVDQVLNARPKDRRLLIEDAAGVSGYKHKRRLTELKLEATQANLLRVNDIVTEVRRQINSLKRQAAKARRYQSLRDEMRKKERIRYALRGQEMDARLEAAIAAYQEATDAETAASGALARTETELGEKRTILDATAQAHREAAEKIHKLEIEIDREEQQIRACRERSEESETGAERDATEAARLAERQAELSAKVENHDTEVERHRIELEAAQQTLAERQAELDRREAVLAAAREELEALRKTQFEAMHAAAELRNRERGLRDAQERTGQQIQRLEQERDAARTDGARLEVESAALAKEHDVQIKVAEELRVQLHENEAGLEQIRISAAEATDTLSQAREREQSEISRLSTLEDVETRFAGVSDGVRLLLHDGPEAGVHSAGVVADYIEAGSDVEHAAEGYLGWILPSVILEEDRDVEAAAGLLRERGAGRTSFICRSQPSGALAVGSSPNGKPVLPDALAADSRVLGRLRERMSLKASSNGALQDRFGDAVLVDCLSTALELHRQHPSSDYLTSDGDVVYASGLISIGGNAEGDQGLLAHKRKMDGARTEVARASALAAELHAEVGDQRREIDRLDKLVREQRAALERANHARVELEHRSRVSDEERDRTKRRAAVLDAELENLAAETTRLGGSMEEIGAEVKQSEAATAQLETQVAERFAASERDERAIKEIAEGVAEARADVAARQERYDALSQERARVTESLSDLTARVNELTSASQSARERATSARDLLAKTEESLARNLEIRRVAAEENAATERVIAESRQTVGQFEAALREGRAALETLRAQTHEREMQRARTEEERKHVDELSMQELGISSAEARELIGEEAEGVEINQLIEEIADLRAKLDAMGGVNLTAIEEFSDLEERYAFLTAQNDDLDKAMNSLKETIRRINRQSRDRFAEAFEAIRISYQEIFKLLFNGGRADLRLEEGEDVLECGIEIMAQPPGKRLTNVQLLSGGEKALSAIALLFAVFRYQPAPFCLLDEVDAPLDDSNVGRFTKMLHEYSDHTQFIIVTHNKISMEAADLMYGVTMEEPGISRLVSMRLQEA